MYGYYITQKGADLMAQALLDESKVTITQCAVGDGGDAEAEKDLSRTALNNETYRKSFDIEDSYALAPDDTDTVMIECIIPSEAGELTVSEIGFFDDTDNLIAYGVLKEQKVNADESGLEYSLDIVSFIELTSEQLSVLKVDLGKANVQAISERVDEFESTVNNTVDEFKSSVNSSITTFETNVNNTVNEFKTDVNGQLDGFRDDIKNLDLGTEIKEDLNALKERVNKYHPAPAYLCEGPTFNSKIRAMEGCDDAKSLVLTKDSPTEDKTLIDVSRDSDNSVVAWIDEYTIYISGYGKTLVAHPNSKSLFRYLSYITDCDLKLLDTSQVVDMTEFFYGCFRLTSLDVSNFDTSNVTNMSKMFYNCGKITSLDVSNFDTSNVTNMSSMFYCCNYLTNLDVSNFDTSNVENFTSMFMNMQSLKNINISYFDTSSATTMYLMFDTCPKLTTLDCSSFDVSNISSGDSIGRMFSYCDNLKTIYANDWTNSSEYIATSSRVFSSSPNLPNFDNTKTSGEYCKLIADGGYFTDPAEAPPKPPRNKPKSLEERVAALEEALNGMSDFLESRI